MSYKQAFAATATEPPDPLLSERKLAAAVMIQAVRDSLRGDTRAKSFMRGKGIDAEMYEFWTGLVGSRQHCSRPIDQIISRMLARNKFCKTWRELLP